MGSRYTILRSNTISTPKDIFELFLTDKGSILIQYKNKNFGKMYTGYQTEFEYCVNGNKFIHTGQVNEGLFAGLSVNIDLKYKIKYHGDYLFGLKFGQGKLRYSNGDIYIGGFENGNRHGQGTYYGLTSQFIVKGVWIYDKITFGKKIYKIEKENVNFEFDINDPIIVPEDFEKSLNP